MHVTDPDFSITVLTPTHNRAHTLVRTYRSLQQQSCRDFEWVVVDDGSTDGTRELIEGWQQESTFPIRYFWQTNQHKKAAFNNGVRNARGELVVELDSDDELLPDALDAMQRVWQGIAAAERVRYVGVTGLCVRPDGNIVGDRFPADVMDATSLDMRFRYGVRGEKFGFQRAAVLKQFPFREDVAGFVSEGSVWNAIARAGYLTRYVNQTFRVYHDSADSLTRSRNPRSNAAGHWLLARDHVELSGVYFRHRPLAILAAAARYTRFAMHLRSSGSPRPAVTPLKHVLPRLLVVGMAPVGMALYARDQILAMRMRKRRA